MSSSVTIAPPNSVVLISDRSGGSPPDNMSGLPVAATPSCIAVGCLMFADGPSEFTLGQALEVSPKGSAAFDGILQTPQRTVVVRTVEGKTLLTATVNSTQTRVRVWVNHPKEPDKVIIGLG